MKLRPELLALGAVALSALVGCGSSGGGASTNADSQTTERAEEVTLYARAPRTVQARRVTIEGEVSPVTEVLVEQEPVEVAPDGSWSRTVALKPGENSFGVNAVVDGGVKAVQIVTVTRKRTRAEIERAIADRNARAEARKVQEEARRARVAARVASWKASAETVSYNQLKKDPDRYAGDRVRFTGQIFQIQEDGDNGGIMLLAVTDEGYDIWTDNVWVNYDRSIKSAEDDIVTVYGTIDGARSYETQIGGETYVPEMTARYIEE